jgi:benzoyl-CoA reductase/2-hydroxyglutaryl-CoA dehydratase subunit BcrC/BadD/HgdB
LVEQAIFEGRTAIGYSCSFVPEPLLMVDGLFPVRLSAMEVTGTEIADNYLSTLICSYARSLLEFAVEDRFDMIQGWVFVPSCAAMQRLSDNLEYLKKPQFMHAIDVPRKLNEYTLAWLAEELRILAKKLGENFHVDTDDSSILKAIEKWNDFANVVIAIGDQRKRDNPPFTGAEFHTMLMAALTSPKDLILPWILEFKDEIENQDGIYDYRARLMLLGASIHDPEFINIIESQGGLVVADRFCTGSVPGMMPVEVKDGPYESLARNIFEKTLCPRMMDDFDRRLENILATVKEYHVDGVVLGIIKFCDLWGVDSAALVKALREEGVPLLKLEREYSFGGEGQLRTRIQAFLESMGK